MDEEEKKAFFDELHKLDEDSDVEDTSEAASMLSKCRPQASESTGSAQSGKSRIINTHSNQSLARTISEPLPQPSSTSFPQIGSSGKVLSSSPTPSSCRHQVKSMKKPPRADVDTRKMATKRATKRKRAQSIETKPESQQIFKDLAFYFLPNNDISPARRFRIRKAIEYGASWIKEWREGITHVIVDEGLTYADLLKYLKLNSLPPNVVLVNEIYPSDCLQFRFLVNPSRSHYRVPGHEEAEASPTTVMASNASLQLKPAKTTVQPEQTPSRTESTRQETIVETAEAPGLDQVPETPQISPDKYPQDALSEAIEEARAVKDLPLDLEEDETPSKSVKFGESDEDPSDDERKTKKAKTKGSLNKSWQQNFSCMSRHDGKEKAENPNSRTIEVLQQMADYYDRTKDQWRTMAYRKVIGQLKKQDRKIVTAAQALEIPWVGERLAAKIEEIVWTNKLRRLENAKLEPNDQSLQTFVKIYGVGFTQASKWLEQGHRTISDLLVKAQLTKNQRIGIEHFDDFQTRIPRQEMQQHDQYVRETVGKIDSSIQITIGGSYRRGASDCGDIDFIITKPDFPFGVLRTIMLETVIPKLFANGYLKVGLATTSKDDGSKWHGAAALPGHRIWRRIDFLLVPWEELGAALIYFTGNDIFNRSIRLLASKKGMRLNQRGLWKDVIRGPHREKPTQGSLVEGRDEKKIFELLGVPWRPPEHRIC